MRILGIEEARKMDVEFIYKNGDKIAIITDKKPIQKENYWACSVCGCSHKLYDEAFKCCR